MAMRGLGRRWLVAAAGGAALAAAASVQVGHPVGQAQGLPPPKGTPAPVRPAAFPKPAEPRRPGETEEQYRQRALREANPGGRTYNLAAETRGKAIDVGGRKVQLPPDAYVEGLVTNVLCVPERACPETPFYNIRQGKSLINVAARSGRVISEHVAPGEELAFEFLKEALR